MVYERVRGWTSGRSLPVQNFVKYPPPPGSTLPPWGAANKKFKIILGEDFSVTLDSDLDCSGGRPFKKDSVKNVQNLCFDFDFVDIWWIRNPERR